MTSKRRLSAGCDCSCTSSLNLTTRRPNVSILQHLRIIFLNAFGGSAIPCIIIGFFESMLGAARGGGIKWAHRLYVF